MALQAVANDIFLETTTSRFSSPDPDLQRGRKRRRNPTEALRTSQLRSNESSTLRGRCRHRSTSRLDTSRVQSRVRGGSISPSRRKFLRVVQLTHHRSQSPSRSRTPTSHPSFAADWPTQPTTQRRQRTISRSRDHGGRASQVLQDLTMTHHINQGHSTPIFSRGFSGDIGQKLAMAHIEALEHHENS